MTKLKKKKKLHTMQKPRGKTKTAAVQVEQKYLDAIGKAIWYWANSGGWYVGYIEAFLTNGNARVRPIGAINGQRPNLTTISIEDIKIPS